MSDKIKIFTISDHPLSPSGVGTQTTTSGGMGSGGAKSLSAELTQIRVTTTGTPDDFDAGAINITTE